MQEKNNQQMIIKFCVYIEIIMERVGFQQTAHSIESRNQQRINDKN